ncbi:transporter associated domain-containing protein, partial [Bacillus velezensis]
GAGIEEEVDTIGGLVLKRNIDICAGESIQIGGYTALILEMDGRFIKQLELKEEQGRPGGQGTINRQLPVPETVMLHNATLSEK